MKNKIESLLLFFILVVFALYYYGLGMKNGIDEYKQSMNMYLTLKSAYHYGYLDCETGFPEDWDNGGN